MNLEYKDKYLKYKKKYTELKKQTGGISKYIPNIIKKGVRRARGGKELLTKLDDNTCNTYQKLPEPAVSNVSFANTNWNNCKLASEFKKQVDEEFEKQMKLLDEYIKEMEIRVQNFKKDLDEKNTTEKCCFYIVERKRFLNDLNKWRYSNFEKWVNTKEAIYEALKDNRGKLKNKNQRPYYDYVVNYLHNKKKLFNDGVIMENFDKYAPKEMKKGENDNPFADQCAIENETTKCKDSKAYKKLQEELNTQTPFLTLAQPDKKV